jgi:hypothetical protein
MRGKGIAEFDSPPPLTMDKVSKSDWKFVKVEPDPNFNPERNRRVIQEVIDETDRIARERKREFQKEVGERSDAIANYISNLEMGGASEDLAKYFGKKYFDYLRGKHLTDKKQSEDGLTIVRNGKVVRRPYEVK